MTTTSCPREHPRVAHAHIPRRVPSLPCPCPLQTHSAAPQQGAEPFHQHQPAAVRAARFSQAKGGQQQLPAALPASSRQRRASSLARAAPGPSPAAEPPEPTSSPRAPHSVPTSNGVSLQSPGSEGLSCSRSRGAALGEAPKGCFAQRGSMVAPRQPRGTRRLLGARLQNLCDKHMHLIAYV